MLNEFQVPQGLAVPGAEGAAGGGELQALPLKGSASRGFRIEYSPNISQCALEQAAGAALAGSPERDVQALARNVDAGGLPTPSC